MVTMVRYRCITITLASEMCEVVVAKFTNCHIYIQMEWTCQGYVIFVNGCGVLGNFHKIALRWMSGSN